MASYKFPESDGSDDGNNLHPRSEQELRLTKLGSNIPIPTQSDIPESEGPEETLHNQVDLINSMIMSDCSRPHVPDTTPSSVTRSKGKLKRPSLGHIHRDPSPALRGDPYDITTLPETVVHSSSTLLPKALSKKPKKAPAPRRPQRTLRTASKTDILDTDPLSDRVVESHSTIGHVHQTHESQEPHTKRRKLDDDVVSEARGLCSGSIPEASASGRTLRSAGVPDLPATSSTIGPQLTRSLGQPVTSGLDPSQPDRRRCRRNDRSTSTIQDRLVVPENDPSPALDKQQIPHRGHSGSRQVVQVVIDTHASDQLPSESTNTTRPPTSPPAVVPGSTIADHLSVPPANVVQDHHRDHISSDHPADPVASSTVHLKDVQSPVFEEAQRSTQGDDALFEPCTQPTRDLQSLPEMVQADTARIQELSEMYPEDDSVDDFAGLENCKGEENRCQDIFMPKELDEALKLARWIHKEFQSVRQRFDGIRILKSYDNLKKRVVQWRAAHNYSETGHLIQLSQAITEEAKSIFQKPVWDQKIGLDYVYKRVLPTLVRTLYITLVYYLSEVGAMKKLPYEPLNESRSVVRAILHIFDQAKDAETRYIRSQDVISMVARIREVLSILDRRLRAHELVKSGADYAERQQTQRLRQEAADRENDDELKLKEWRQRWIVLHDQRLGAAMEGRTFLSDEQVHHLRQIPLDNLHDATRYWDDTDAFYLVEGLEKFKGPNVYREIFRKYCLHGGPLQRFNVAEIVEKAVSLKGSILKLAEDEGDELDQWVEDIFDPRVPPEGLPRIERRQQD